MNKLSVLVLLLVTALTACSSDPSDPETQIRAVLEQMEVAAEARSRRDISAHISADYLDNESRTKKSVEDTLRLYLLANQSINLFTRIHSIEVQPNNRARVELSVAMAARGVDLTQESNRLKADLHRFSVLLEDESGDGEWKVIAADWQRGW